jgi:glycosyltransferase involved in cell wall biosynthesis
MLGLAEEIRDEHTTVFASFSEGGLCRDFLGHAAAAGFECIELPHDTPRLYGAYRDVRALIRNRDIQVLLCHGYKAGLVGLLAARKHKIPAVAVSRGWTSESVRVRMYERLDRRVMRWADRVVCVSHAQAAKVARSGVAKGRISVIWDSVRCDRFAASPADARQELLHLFSTPPERIVGAAGRLSPEKGFEHLVDAAARVIAKEPTTGFVLFGDGVLRERLQRQIDRLGIADGFLLAGFRRDLDRFLPGLDVFTLPSYTEGLPNVVLEALAARVPVVATAVGGTPEALEDGEDGFLVPPGEPGPLADRILALLSDSERRAVIGLTGQRHVQEKFSFASQGRQYCDLLERLCLMAG